MRLFRYLLRQQVSHGLVALLVLSAIYLLAELGDQGVRVAAKVGWWLTLQGSLWGAPAIVLQVAPMAVVVGGIMAMMRLDRRGELDALSLAGSPPRVMLLASTLSGACFFAVMLLLAALVLPETEGAKERWWGSAAARLAGTANTARWHRLPGRWFAKSQGDHTLAISLDSSFRVQGRLVFREHDKTRQPLSAHAFRSPHTSPTLKQHFQQQASSAYQQLRQPAAALTRGATPAMRRNAGHDDVGAILLHQTTHAFPWLCLVAGLIVWRVTAQCRHGARGAMVWLGQGLGWIVLLWLLLSAGWQGARLGLWSPQLGGWLVVLGGAGCTLASGLLLHHPGLLARQKDSA